MRFVLVATASTILLAGCASMSENECLYADWQAIGFEDGAVGMPSSAVTSRRQACAKAGVTPDMAAYLAGRDQGLTEYCTPGNAFRVGENGAGYAGVCARHNEASFLDQYRAGARLYLLRDKLRSAEFALRQANEDLSSVQHGITLASAALVRPDLTVSERIAYVVDLKRLAEEGEAIERSIPGLRMNIDLAAADLEDYETQLAALPAFSTAQVAAR
jgi:hypothetical protein